MFWPGPVYNNGIPTYLKLEKRQQKELLEITATAEA